MVNTMTRKIEVVLADTEELRNKAFEIRKEVFVVEQQVDARDEFDEYETSSTHFVALQGEEPVGAARWRMKSDGIKLERFAVKRELRGKGVGSMLVQAVLDDIQHKEGGGKYLYLHAQLAAMPLYAKHGFVKVGPQFEECNIQHFKMDRLS